ncbi:uncharacterized proline-rich protein-like, partial [Trichoplusia ni]|uniref:Uncharacterized proline-rich protein-like n=1 Tax=Trichoplusia ni TaxID=7111 RepID=A0A7E5X137_TRINI
MFTWCVLNARRRGCSVLVSSSTSVEDGLRNGLDELNNSRKRALQLLGAGAGPLCAGAGGAACSPGSCGGASPPAPGSAPPSAPPASPHHQPTPSQTAGVVPTTLHTPAPTPDPLAPPTPAPPSLPPPKTYTQGDSPLGCEVSRRPVLPAAAPRLDPLEDEHSLHMLYDYTTVYAWLEHPVKRFKSSQSSFREEMALGAGAGADLYAGHDHTRMAAARDHNAAQLKHERDHA